MMTKNNIIESVGYKEAIKLFIVAIISFFISTSLGYILLLGVLLTLYMYRNPIIGFIPRDKNNLMTPIEGKVVAIDKINKNYEIYIDVNLSNAHIFRAPKDSKYKCISKINGLNLCHNTLQGKLFNTQKLFSFDDIKIEFLSGFFNKEFDFTDEKEVKTFDMLGIFLHGSVKVSFLSSQYIPTIKVGQKLKYETLLAKSID